MPFGDILADLNETELEDASGNVVKLKGNLAKLALRLFGIPHIGLRNRASKIFSMLKLRRKDLVLDAGAGYGIYSLSIANKVEKVYSVDIEERRIKQIKRFHNENIIAEKMDIRNLKFKKDYFDTIICSDVLEHTENYGKAFSELSRVLKKNGQLILTVPNFSKSNIKNYKKFGHILPGYRYGELLELCKKNNMKIEETKFYACSLSRNLEELHSKFIKNKSLTALFFYPFYFLSKLDFLFKNKKDCDGICLRIRKL